MNATCCLPPCPSLKCRRQAAGPPPRPRSSSSSPTTSKSSCAGTMPRRQAARTAPSAWWAHACVALAAAALCRGSSRRLLQRRAAPAFQCRPCTAMLLTAHHLCCACLPRVHLCTRGTRAEAESKQGSPLHSLAAGQLQGVTFWLPGSWLEALLCTAPAANAGHHAQCRQC